MRSLLALTTTAEIVGPDGRLWVVEMGDYPRGAHDDGVPGGKVRVLTDLDGLAGARTVRDLTGHHVAVAARGQRGLEGLRQLAAFAVDRHEALVAA